MSDKQINLRLPPDAVYKLESLAQEGEKVTTVARRLLLELLDTSPSSSSNSATDLLARVEKLESSKPIPPAIDSKDKLAKPKPGNISSNPASKVIATDSKMLATDSKMLATASKVIATASKVIADSSNPASKVIAADSKVIAAASKSIELPSDGAMMHPKDCAELLGLKFPSGWEGLTHRHGTDFEREGYRFVRSDRKRGRAFLWSVVELPHDRQDST